MNPMTIMWAVWLAAMLIATLITVNAVLLTVFSKYSLKSRDDVAGGLACIMWAVWYMFFLH